MVDVVDAHPHRANSHYLIESEMSGVEGSILQALTGERFSRRLLSASLALAVLLIASPVLATNGMNMIGYGAVSSGMGGADLAVVDNASAMNINPAGICSCAGPQLIVGTSVLTPKLNHVTADRNNSGVDNHFLLPMIAYVTPLKTTGFMLGVGAFAQGGMGAEYSRLPTPFATADEIYSNLSYGKLTPTLAWQSPNTRLKLGAGAHIGQVNTELKYFPNTFVDGSFDGFRVDDLEAFGYSLRLGFQYHLGRLTLGGSWISKTDLEFSDGDLVFASDPSGTQNARLEGFNWPQQVGLGLKYSVNPTLRVAADIEWMEWSRAVERIVLEGDDTTIAFDMNWDDQWVYAIGAEWEFTPDWVMRLGYNHGSSPVPDTPGATLFPAIIEDHATMGFGYASSRWRVDLAYEHGFENSLKNSLAGAVEKHEQNIVHAMMTWMF